ncbi:methyltransferase, partial [Streptomyces sp. NPDC059455]|uniref:methyltransferase n=1 Tax=Streptomyces sp. NPDC059455 TaxID=3346837 RepID=UPI00368C1662
GFLAYRAPPLRGGRPPRAAAGCAVVCRAALRPPPDSVRAGADAYLLNHLVRDVDDDAALALLAGCRGAMAPDARLILLETVIPTVLTPADSAGYGLTDLNNLIYAGGRERTAEEYRGLLEAAGFRFVDAIAVPSAEGLPDYNVIEAEPASGHPARTRQKGGVSDAVYDSGSPAHAQR